MSQTEEKYTVLLSEGNIPQRIPVFETPGKVLARYFDRFDVVHQHGFDFWVHDEFLFHVTDDSVPSVIFEDENGEAYDILFGNVLVFKSNEEGETLPLDGNDLERLADLLKPIRITHRVTRERKTGTVVRP
ncbi:hypothetical protein EXIGUO8H_170002 [Exiguobacterium sp. 8H]|uniref:hypothetical protein n=1 Tax=Exiguobacterium sp. 8H TaxID=2653140 RepID=UPI0012F14B9E|nr:hypothetical protein [Exiguobacterium sp. 8H]VXB38869.1 hypothetical protein EXIGUO8H_170002 [Exiguobacterium sp. 8H]